MSYTRISNLIKIAGPWYDGQTIKYTAPAAGLTIYDFSGVTEPNYLSYGWRRKVSVSHPAGEFERQEVWGDGDREPSIAIKATFHHKKSCNFFSESSQLSKKETDCLAHADKIILNAMTSSSEIEFEDKLNQSGVKITNAK